jgi:hypothetical protein
MNISWQEKGWTSFTTEHKIQRETQAWATPDVINADRDGTGTWLFHICLEDPDSLVLNLLHITQLRCIIYIVLVLNNIYLVPRIIQYIKGTHCIPYSQHNINIAIFKTGMQNSVMLCCILCLSLYLECIKKYERKFDLRKLNGTQLNY